MTQQLTDLIDKLQDVACGLACACDEKNLTDAHAQAIQLAAVSGKIRTILWDMVQKRKDQTEPWP